MIDVDKVLGDIPHFRKFCSVTDLQELANSLSADDRFDVKVAGKSADGAPLHHIKFGHGATKALFVAFPHCMEPIGGLTVYSLLSLLREGRVQSLLDADVEWHFVPCIDPDGATRNERWSQEEFTLDNFMRHFFMQASGEQVDVSFPIAYKSINVVDQPLVEGRVLRSIIDEVRPDFFFSLHNYCCVGGVFYLLNKDIGTDYYERLYGLLAQLDFPLQETPALPQLRALSKGIVEMNTFEKSYDFLERTAPSTELGLAASSWDYLASIKPDALTFIAESGLVLHPDELCQNDTGASLRRLKLEIDANSKFLASMLLEEWENVKDEVDKSSPLYRAILGGFVIPTPENLVEGGVPMSTISTRDILFGSARERSMTVAERFNVCMSESGYRFLFLSYPLVQLLKESDQTEAITSALSRIEPAYDEVLAELKRHVDFTAFKPICHQTLAKVQLGSGLIVLNSLLEHGA